MFRVDFKMKIITILLVGILLISTQVFADLSVSDLEKIEAIVKDSEARMKEYVSQEIEKVNIRITEMDKRLTTTITEMDKRLTTTITEMDKRLTSDIKSVEKQLTIGINALDNQVGRNFNLVLGLIALIAVAVGLPQIITAWQGRKLREHTEKYDALKQEIEMLKQERIVRH